MDNKFKNVRVNKLQPAKVAALLKDNDDIFILDVRPQNFKKGPQFIKGSYHCPLIDIVDSLEKFPRDKEIIIVDWKMYQSPLAAKYLQSEGFKVKGVVRRGIERWMEEGFPVEVRQIEN